MSTAICWSDLETDEAYFHFNGYLKGFLMTKPTNCNPNYRVKILAILIQELAISEECEYVSSIC